MRKLDSGVRRHDCVSCTHLPNICRVLSVLQVQKRPVRLGQALDGQVEIITGLEPGERFVVNSSKPLQNGEKVRISILSSP